MDGSSDLNSMAVSCIFQNEECFVQFTNSMAVSYIACYFVFLKYYFQAEVVIQVLLIRVFLVRQTVSYTKILLS